MSSQVALTVPAPIRPDQRTGNPATAAINAHGRARAFVARPLDNRQTTENKVAHRNRRELVHNGTEVDGGPPSTPSPAWPARLSTNSRPEAYVARCTIRLAWFLPGVIV